MSSFHPSCFGRCSFLAACFNWAVQPPVVGWVIHLMSIRCQPELYYDPMMLPPIDWHRARYKTPKFCLITICKKGFIGSYLSWMFWFLSQEAHQAWRCAERCERKGIIGIPSRPRFQFSYFTSKTRDLETVEAVSSGLFLHSSSSQHGSLGSGRWYADEVGPLTTAPVKFWLTNCHV